MQDSSTAAAVSPRGNNTSAEAAEQEETKEIREDELGEDEEEDSDDEYQDVLGLEEKLKEDGSHGGFKHKLGNVLGHFTVELAIVLLIFVDIAIISCEYGIEHHIICIGGDAVKMPPEEIGRLVASSNASALDPADDDVHAKKQHAHLLQDWDGMKDGSAYVFPQFSKEGSAYVFPQRSDGQPKVPLSRSLLQSAPTHRSPSGLSRGVYGGVGDDSQADDAVLLEKPGQEEVERAEKHVRGGVTYDVKKEDGAGAHGGQGHRSSLVCEGRHGHTVHEISHQCHFWSVVIVGIFAVELCLKVWVHPTLFFFSGNKLNKTNILDLFVVMLSLIIDLFLRSIISYIQNKRKLVLGFDIASIIVIGFRSWRVCRVFHGIFETANKAYSHVAKLKKDIKECKETLEEREVHLKECEDKLQAAKESPLRSLSSAKSPRN